jgi:creatinine amidohydrolase
LSFYFQEKTWPELKEYVDKNALIILPVGEIEEHSLYLPVDTDARIAAYLSAQLAEEIEREIPVLVMPAIWSGYTPKYIRKFPGGMGLRPQVFTEMVHDICASIADMGFEKLFMLDCHGQHGPMLNMVTKLIADEYGYYYSCATPIPFFAEEFNKIRKSDRGGASHACEYEASLIMHISPELVKPELFTGEDALKHHSKFVSGDAVLGGQKVVWSTFGIQETKYGACGDPTGASAETGRIITEAFRKNASEFMREYYFHKRIVPRE